MTSGERLLALAAMLAPLLCCSSLARARRPGRVAAAGALATAVIALVWNRHRAAYEGPTIVALSRTHGLTLVDMVLPASLAVAGAVLYRFWKG